MRVIAFLLSCAVAFAAIACGSEDPPPSSGSGQEANTPATQPSQQAPYDEAPAWGVSLSPRSYSQADFTAFFEEAAQVGDLIGWYGDWAELVDPQAAPAVVAELAGQYDYQPLFIANVYDSEAGLHRPLDEAQQDEYVQSAAAFAERYEPSYFGFGIEVNVLYERWPKDFEAFVSLFDEAARAVKEVSPRTRVFTVFQLERMKGLQGGLFGGTNDATLAQWDLIERFPRADLIAFTTYPGIIYQTPQEIPEDYYAGLEEKAGKPIAFTEIGWPSQLDVAGWQSDEQEQAAFARRFLELTADLEPELLIWSFLYDPQGLPDPFRGTGLRRPDGSPRPVWDVITGRSSPSASD